jgi:hypothetical protein
MYISFKNKIPISIKLKICNSLDYISDVMVCVVYYGAFLGVGGFLFNFLVYLQYCRSRWPSGLRHVLSSLARKPGSWVRIPRKAWMFGMCMCLFCVWVVLCLGSGLATSWSLVQGVLPSVKWSWNWKNQRPGPTGGGGPVEPVKKKSTIFVWWSSTWWHILFFHNSSSDYGLNIYCVMSSYIGVPRFPVVVPSVWFCQGSIVKKSLAVWTSQKDVVYRRLHI